MHKYAIGVPNFWDELGASLGATSPSALHPPPLATDLGKSWSTGRWARGARCRAWDRTGELPVRSTRIRALAGALAGALADTRIRARSSTGHSNRTGARHTTRTSAGRRSGRGAMLSIRRAAWVDAGTATRDGSRNRAGFSPRTGAR
jgi:hypothetical protein